MIAGGGRQPVALAGSHQPDLPVVPYDPAWPRLYASESRRIRAALGRRLESVEHVGSSSVPGMGGRAEVDILLGVRTMRDADACVSRLRRLGYDEPPGRERYAGEWRFLTRSGPVLFEMLIVRDRGPYWRHVVRFRDHLRASPEAARRYEEVKRAASLKCRSSDPATYAEEKRRFQGSVLGTSGGLFGTASSSLPAPVASQAPVASLSPVASPAPAIVPAPAPGSRTTPLELVRLPGLMRLTEGSPAVRIGLIDGPVAASHPSLAGATIREVGTRPETCRAPGGAACRHGTFVAGILMARRGSAAPGICPGCMLLSRPIFRDTGDTGNVGEDATGMPTATPGDLAAAITDCLDAGVQVLNVSAALLRPSGREERLLGDALSRAHQVGTIVVVAAGNHATVGSSPLTRHPGVIPVVAYGLGGRPMSLSNVGPSIGRRGLGAPGEGVVSLTPEGGLSASEGTSVAAAFVTGTIALLWSEQLTATRADLEAALVSGVARRRSVVPPLLDAWGAWLSLSGSTLRPATRKGSYR